MWHYVLSDKENLLEWFKGRRCGAYKLAASENHCLLEMAKSTFILTKFKREMNNSYNVYYFLH